jgi:diguanylate cyclase (GGDEF)-like protein
LKKNIKTDTDSTVINKKILALQGELQKAMAELQIYKHMLKVSEDRINRLAVEGKKKRCTNCDPLTGTALRKEFMDKLQHSINDAKKDSLMNAVMYLGIDNFKNINDTYGHNIGDKFLKEITGRFKACIREIDSLCRISGDEFALLVPYLTDINPVDEMANSIIDLFNQPLFINGHKIHNTISIGIAVYPNNCLNGQALLKKAYIAMHKAKENGKGRLQYYNNSIGREMSLRHHIENDLRTAMENNEFFICYQPLVNIKTGRMVCTEALIRWRHPVKGVISPLKFIPVAEELNLIIPIGEWVLKTACTQLKAWHNMGFNSLSLSVNVSAIQLQQAGFADSVCSILAEKELIPKYLELEITESAYIHSNYIAEKNLYCLKKKGVRISIDDFGTGYCCLEYLQKTSVNSLKIDRRFISNIKVNVNKAIIDSVILLGHKLNIDITAEGVETKDQYEYLEKKGCDKVQGYYFSKPLLPEEITELLKE